MPFAKYAFTIIMIIILLIIIINNTDYYTIDIKSIIINRNFTLEKIQTNFFLNVAYLVRLLEQERTDFPDNCSCNESKFFRGYTVEGNRLLR